MQPDDVDGWYVRNAQGEMTPFSAFATGRRWTYGSPRLERFNGLPSMEIVGEPAPGKSSGDARDVGRCTWTSRRRGVFLGGEAMTRAIARLA